MKIATVVGARPQFVKAAAVSRVLRPKVNEILIHTGQHYDANMSDIFFEEMNIPRPDHNLGVGSGSHAKQTAEMMVGIERILLDVQPDYLLIYGDTNSTLAGALAAVKIHIPIIHVEAGLRSFNMSMPEEVNRILSDRISAVLFCPTDKAVENLRNEGICKGVFNIGDVMCDAVKFYLKKSDAISHKEHIDNIKIIPDSRVAFKDKWYLATIHRADNTDSLSKIQVILNAFESFDAPVIFPVHPRTRGLIDKACDMHSYKNIVFCEPMGYLDMLYFAKNANKIITDSGGLQKEAYIMDTPCVTLRTETEWVETLNGNRNVLASLDKDDILNKVYNTKIDTAQKINYYGDGHAAEQLLNILENYTL